MYTVVMNGNVLYLGNSLNEMAKVWSENQQGATGEVIDLDDLVSFMESSKECDHKMFHKCSDDEVKKVEPSQPSSPTIEDHLDKIADRLEGFVDKVDAEVAQKMERFNKVLNDFSSKVNERVQTMSDNLADKTADSLNKLADKVRKK